MGIQVIWDVRLNGWVSSSGRFKRKVLRNVRNHAPNDATSRIRSGKSSVKQELENKSMRQR
jgi:hypothetical protein